MVWLGNGDFEDFGYQKVAFVKGQAEGILPTYVYRIEDRGPPNSEAQYWFVPVDANGNQIGPDGMKTAGQVVYGYWQDWKTSEQVFISNFYQG